MSNAPTLRFSPTKRQPQTGTLANRPLPTEVGDRYFASDDNGGTEYVSLDGLAWTQAGPSVNAAAGGDLTGTYPSPTIGSGKVTSAAIADGTIVLGDTAQSLIDAIMPWRIDILPYIGTTAMAGTVGAFIVGSTANDGGLYNPSNAQNDEYGWDVVLAKGTWTFYMMYQKAAGDAIATVNLGGSSQGTIDTYNASTTYNNISSIASISVAATGKQRLSLKAATRNASNTTGWTLAVQQVTMVRTA